MSSGIRWSGVAGLAFAGVLVIGFVMDGLIAMTTGGPPQLVATTIGADLVRSGSSQVWRIELWIYIFAAVPFAMFLPGARTSVSGRDAVLAQIGAVAAALFIVFHTVHNIAYVAIVAGIAPTYAAGASTAAASEEVARGLIAFAEASFLPGGGVGGALLAVALFAFGTAQRRAGSRALGTVAIAAAMLTALGYIGLVVWQAGLVIGLVGWIAFIVWSALTGRSLLREARAG